MKRDLADTPSWGVGFWISINRHLAGNRALAVPNFMKRSSTFFLSLSLQFLQLRISINTSSHERRA